MKRHAYRYLRWHLGLALGVAAAVAAVNFSIDPLQFYRPSSNFMYKLARYLNPGLVRHREYDSVIIGTSHTANFVKSEIRDAWGWDTLKLTVPGGNMIEQSETLLLALKTKKVKRVLWCLDKQAFDDPLYEQSITESRLPEHLYYVTWTTHLRYLVSLDTLYACYKMQRGKDVSHDFDHLYCWYERADFGEELVWHSLARELKTRVAIDRIRYDRGYMRDELLQRNSRQYLYDIVKEYPDVEFVIFWPPYPIVHYMYDYAIADDFFATRQRFKRQVNETLLTYPNVRVYDFQPVERHTHNLDLYWDIGHYSKEVTDYIVDSIAEDRHRVTPGNNRELVDELTRQVEAFRLEMPERMKAWPEVASRWPREKPE